MGHHSPFLLKLISPPCEFSPSLFHMCVSFGTDHFAHPVNKSVLKWIDEHGDTIISVHYASLYHQSHH